MESIKLGPNGEDEITLEKSTVALGLFYLKESQGGNVYTFNACQARHLIIALGELIRNAPEDVHFPAAVGG